MKAGRIAVFALLAVLGLAVAGMVVPRPLFRQAAAAPVSLPRTVLVLSNLIHTDIAFPADPDVLERLGFLGASGLEIFNPGVRWIILGWGGRAFYLETPTWSDLKPGPVFKAFTYDRSVMHVVLAGPISASADGVAALVIGDVEFNAMLDKAIDGFALGMNGEKLEIPGRSYGQFDRFYEAIGGFNMLVGCNTWTASTLRAGGIRTGWWNPLPASLVWSLELFNSCAAGIGLCTAGQS